MIGTNWLSNLKKFDRERFDSLRHLDSERRKEIAAIYSFNLELANIAWNVSEPEPVSYTHLTLPTTYTV